MQTHTHYSNLQIVETASPEVIKGAYKALAHKWHPDKNPDKVVEAERVFKIITDAYDVLSDSEKRALYDAGLAEQRRVSTPQQRERSSSTGAAEPPQSNAHRGTNATSPPNQASSAPGGTPSKTLMDLLAEHPLFRLVIHPPRTIVIAVLVAAWLAIFGKQLFR